MKNTIVDVRVGMCTLCTTCFVGQTGNRCKHQSACAELGIFVLPQQIQLTEKVKRRIAVLAVGEKAPPSTFYRPLMPPTASPKNQPFTSTTMHPPFFCRPRITMMSFIKMAMRTAKPSQCFCRPRIIMISLSRHMSFIKMAMRAANIC